MRAVNKCKEEKRNVQDIEYKEILQTDLNIKYYKISHTLRDFNLKKKT